MSALTLFILLTLGYARAASVERPRLGEDTLPVSYDLAFVIDPHKTVFSGDETIVVEVKKPAENIILNWRGLTADGATIDEQPAELVVHAKVQQLWVHASAPLAAGRHRLHVHFTSAVRDMFGPPPSGFWNDSMKDPFLVTMFEPSTARVMFPCFDEPQLRASFTVHVTAPSEYAVISNMPVQQTAQAGASTRTDFTPSPPMPAYLLTIDVGKMEYVASQVDGVPIRVYGAPGTKGMDLTLARAQRILHYYDTYLGVRYPLPKLDIILAPGGFHSALEQWGAITFYEGDDVTTGSNADAGVGERRAFSELAHEMAHQWFGNLVGMRCWRDAFVSEGVAEWLQSKADATIGPSPLWFRESDSDVDRVLSNPLTARTPPVINNRVVTDYDADDFSAFSDATYYKSAALLNTWEAYIGEPRFKAALRRYLSRYAGSTATFEQFWGAFDDPKARAYGDAWLKRPGFPEVTVSSSCRNGERTLRFTQKPFHNLSNSLGTPPGYLAQIWPVPIFVSAGKTELRYVLTQSTGTLRAGSCGEAISVDRNLRPYYRIHFAQAAAAARSLQSAGERDRSNALRDAIALQNAGMAPAGYFLDFAVLARSDDDPLLLRSVAWTFAGLLQALTSGSERNAVSDRAIAFAMPIVTRTPAATTHNELQAYGAALNILALTRSDFFADTAQERLKALLVQKTQTGFDDRVYRLAAIAALHANAERVSAMEAVLADPSADRTPWRKVAAFAYLTNLASPTLAKEVLPGYGSRPEFVFSLAQRQPALVWQFLQGHTAKLLAHTPAQKATIFTQEVTSTLWSAAPPAALRAYFERSLGPNNRTVVDTAMKDIEARRLASAQTATQVRLWLAQRRVPLPAPR